MKKNQSIKTMAFALLTFFSTLINAQTFKANFSYTVDSVDCTTVTFIDSSTGNPSFYNWNFGDFSSGYGQNVTHTYSVSPNTQIFDVTLMIFDYDSLNAIYNSDTITKSITIAPCDICQINAMIDLGGDSTIAFAGTLYNMSNGTINKHYWNFGDGGTSTSNTPVHTYANPGKYTIVYIASDTIKNCTDTAWVSFTIDSAGFLKRQAFVLTVIDKTSTGLSKASVAKNKNLKVYPNPASEFIKLEGLQQNINIFDLNGHKIGTYQLNKDEVLAIQIDSWSKGLYMIVGENKESQILLIE